jgi:hypothetical protein
MLQTDLFFNEAKSIFIVTLLIFILKEDTIMVIIRNGTYLGRGKRCSQRICNIMDEWYCS